MTDNKETSGSGNLQNSEVKLTLQENIDLWKYFESIGASDKDRMVAIVTWLLTFATAILAYIATKDVDLTQSQLQLKNSLEAIVLAALGLFICGVSGYLVYAFGVHADRNWERAEIYREKIPGLDKLFISESKKSQIRFAMIFRVFFIFVGFLFLCFMFIIIWSLVKVT